MPVSGDRSSVLPDLFIGSKPVSGPHSDIDVIVLAAEEHQPDVGTFPGVEVIHAPLDDDPTRGMRPDEIMRAAQAASLVARHLRAGRRVLSTCAAGLNRSSLIASLAMNDVHRMHPDEIIRRIRAARGPWALSNPNFERLLRLVAAARHAEGALSPRRRLDRSPRATRG